MSDIYFEYAFLPRSPVEHAARLAVLYRLHDHRSPNPIYPSRSDEWKMALRQILGLWRSRVSELCNLGVARFAIPQVPRAGNCHPWGIAVKPYQREAVYCHKNDICPWCASRAVGEFYTLVRRTLRPDDAVLTVTHVDYFRDFSIDNMRLKLDWCRKTLRGLVRANEDNRAAYWSITAEPPSSLKPQDNRFCVRCRLLMLMPIAEPGILIPNSRGWRVNRVHEPDEKMCQKLVARVCAYPIGLLTGSAENVQKIFAVKKGMRLSEISGAFRGQPVEVDTHSEE